MVRTARRAAGARAGHSRAAVVVLHALLGWVLLCGGAAAGAERAVAAAVGFGAAASRYFSSAGAVAMAPLTAAVAFTVIVAQLELFVTALVMRGGLEMYGSVWEGLAPLAAVFGSTLLAGQCVRHPAPPPPPA